MSSWEAFSQGSEKPGFLKKTNPVGFLVLMGFGLYWIFPIFNSNEQLGSLIQLIS